MAIPPTIKIMGFLAIRFMNKKGAMGPIAAIGIFVIFLLNWFIWLGAWISEVGQESVVSGNLDGIEAFIFLNLNFILFIVVILAMMGWMYVSTGSQ
jgi:hypothetical protein